jgi:hypothetical protein
MKIYVAYGFFTALGFALISMLLFYLGLDSDPAKYDGGQLIGGVACGLIAIAGIFAGIKAKRDSRPPNANFSYGEGLKTGVMIAVFTGLFSAVFNYLYNEFINPQFGDITVQAQLLKMKAVEATPAEMAATEKAMRELLNPFIHAGIVMVIAIVAGAVIAALAALALKRTVTTSRFAK